MATQIATVETLKKYIEGIAGRADHHAGTVNEVIFPLIGALIWRHEIGSIEVLDHSGDMKNVLWIKVGTNKYYFAYNHEALCIEIKSNNNRGPVMRSFSNSTPLPEIIEFFRTL